MGTKADPAPNDCYEKALPDEPMFVLLARDPDFARLLWEWADKRVRDVRCGERPESDLSLAGEARRLALMGEEWRRTNMGKWRK